MMNMIWFIISLVGVTKGGSDDWGLFEYEPGEWETMVVDLIARQVATLPIEDFSDDPQLLQQVDRLNKFSVYKQMVVGAEEGGEMMSVVYRRKSVDAKEPIVILGSHEDKLEVHERKRTFVVLRQNPETNNTYFVSYVYLRFWTDKQAFCLDTYLNEKICLEFDTWDNNRGEVKAGNKYFGWGDCASSFLFSCSNHTKEQKDHKEEVLVERGYRNQTMDYHQPNSSFIKFKPAPGLPMDDTIDALFDLEVLVGEGHYIRETIRHSSIFRHPAKFLSSVPSEEPSSKGRSFSGAENVSLSNISSMKEKLMQESLAKKAEKEELHTKLKGRMEWHRYKADLNNILHNYTKILGYESFPVVSKDPGRLQYLLKTFRNASNVIKELKDMGETFQVDNEIVAKRIKTKEPDKVYLLLEAENNEALVMIENSPSTTAFGRALSASVKESGGSMNGRAFGEVDTKVAETIAKSILFSSVDTFQIPGWKLQEIDNFKPNSTLDLESLIFYGLGSCKYKKVKELPVKPNNEKVMDFFLTLLRTYCLPKAKEYLTHLLHHKFLEVEGKKLILAKNMTLTQKRKLRADEFRQLSAALEISSFSHNYEEEMRHEWSDSSAVSRSVHYLQQFGFYFVSQARKLGDEHFIKLIRNLVITFKGVMTKLLQDLEMLLNFCAKKKCQLEMDLNYQDRLGIHSFMEFLIRGLNPLEKIQNANVETVFMQFIKDNREALSSSLEYYN